MFTILPYLLCNVYAESSQAVCWWVIATDGTQAVWGLLQIYGVYGSSHSLFRLAGSFYNPGPKAFTDMKNENRCKFFQHIYIPTNCWCIITHPVMPCSGCVT